MCVTVYACVCVCVCVCVCGWVLLDKELNGNEDSKLLFSSSSAV